MFLIYEKQLGTALYITGVEEIAKNFCTTQEQQGKTLAAYREVAALGGVDKDCTGLSGLIEAMPACELEVAGVETITAGQKQFILNSLGFQPRGKGVWWHRCLGADEIPNRILFNLSDDAISRLPEFLVNSGYNSHKAQITDFLNEVTLTKY